MSQRIVAGLAAVPLVAVMWILAALVPLPYVTYHPGPTVDVLGKNDGSPIIQIDGHKTYADGGQLRLTTIFVDEPQDRVGLLQLLGSWWDRDAAVYPRSAVYADDATDASEDEISTIQMVSSQDAAVAAALTELDYDLPSTVQVFNVEDGMPAAGKLQFGDRIVSIGGTDVSTPDDVVAAVRAEPAGTAQEWVLERDEKTVRVRIASREVDGAARVGVTPGPSYDFPFDVHIDLGGGIGGPSAGLVFALGIYDVLTPGSLTDGASIAGTGEIDSTGRVGPIGGAQQKVAAARDQDVQLFLVPADNCASLGGVKAGDMRVVPVRTMGDALDTIGTWTADNDAKLPTCEDAR